VSSEINEVLDAAAEISVKRSQYYVGVEHLFEVLISMPERLPPSFVQKYLGNFSAVARQVALNAWRGVMPEFRPEVFYTPRCASATTTAAKLSRRYGDGKPRAGHLLLAIIADAHSAPARAMDELKLPRGDYINGLRDALGKESPKRAKAQSNVEERDVGESPAAKAAESSKSDSKKEAASLESMTRDLTALAQEGKLQAAIGRDQEMYSVLEVMARKNKNNVILVGEAGVGKTQIVEGLALTTAGCDAGPILSDARILELNIASLMSGTQYRGSFEEKVLALLEQLKKDPNLILFIDEIHLIMGAGATDGGSPDIANLLKPVLARGEIRCIGATTLKEYRKFIERDPAIERRFQLVRVEPLSESATWEVLRKLRPSFQEHHGVRISRRAMRDSITLTQRYLPNRQLPDKAIDILDQACARHRLRAIAAKTKPGLFDSDDGRPQEAKVVPHDVRKVLSQMTSIPIEEITHEERRRLGDLETTLSREIIGQDEAIAKSAAAMKKARAGLADPNRPDAVLLFLGPTGVGKTQLAKSLARHVFGSEDHLVTFDMSEFIEEHSVAKLLGAPPGYVGSEEEGRLVTAVRDKPFSILLFDEVEKAHPRIFDIFLPILDEGRLKDAHGRLVSFKNCIIIFTSNIAAKSISRQDSEEFDGKIIEELQRHFRPEFINRIDEIVPFHHLIFEDVRSILAISVKGLKRRLREKQIRIHLYQGAYELIAERGYNKDFGARELRRAFERLVVNPMSEKMMAGEFGRGDRIEILEHDGALVFRKAANAEPKEAISA
jgi:ATP-dependent Clp protease ATP-binding subunit ClpC